MLTAYVMIKEVDNMLSVHFHYLVGLLICPFEFLFKYVHLSKSLSKKEVMSDFGLIAQLGFYLFIYLFFSKKESDPWPLFATYSHICFQVLLIISHKD